jgi:hypothetical protein
VSQSTPSGQINPAPRATWPNFAAVDYGKPGQPHLTNDQIAKLRFTLARVKSCQRRFVRYAFPSDDVRPFVLYFELDATPDPQGHVDYTHVLGDRFVHYAPVTGETTIGPIGSDDPEGASAKLAHEYEWQPDYPCTPSRD